MKIRTLLPLLSLATLPAWAESFQSGDLEVVVNALPATELTPEASQSYNVARAPNRGVLTVLVHRHRGGRRDSVPAQIYAGAMNAQNHLINIPIREWRAGDEVQYLGEFRLNGTNDLRFLVNVNVLGRLIKAEFNRVFPAR